MRFPALRIKTLIMFFNWFSSAFMLYGIALNWGSLTGSKLWKIRGNLNYCLSGDLFMNFAIADSLDFPGKLLALVSTVWLGSRLPYISLSLTAGVSFLLVLILPAHLSIAARVTCSLCQV